MTHAPPTQRHGHLAVDHVARLCFTSFDIESETLHSSNHGELRVRRYKESVTEKGLKLLFIKKFHPYAIDQHCLVEVFCMRCAAMKSYVRLCCLTASDLHILKRRDSVVIVANSTSPQ